MSKRLRTSTILFLMFFSLSGTVSTEPPILVETSPVYEMKAREEEPVIFHQTLISPQEEKALLLDEELSAEMSLDLQNQVLERQIQQAEDMGNELDDIIQMLEE